MPSLGYWGAALGDEDLASLGVVTARPVARATLDVETPIGLIAESGGGFSGSPGISGHRLDGQGFGPRFTNAAVTTENADGRATAVWTLEDKIAELAIALTATLHTGSDVLLLSAEVTNVGTCDYTLDRLAPSVELPARAVELLHFTGRWTMEFQPDRHRWETGAWVSENRRGRTSHDRIPALFAGSDGFSETTGEVWGVHLGWSGNATVIAERLSDGRRHVQAGELLFGGEVMIGPGESYRTPVLHGVYSASGLGDASLAFHRFVRSRSHHPGTDRPRPVMLNTWEAVYFDHDHDTLTQLATLAAEVGVERFVLDDGWFVGRNDDTAGLGDWTVDPAKYPNGLGPLVDHVRGLGMEFGLWLEPEMVNPESVLYRTHPEWALEDDRYPRQLGRNQLVLDLANPDAWNYILEHVDRLLSEYEIGYVKWDMNRDLVQPTHDGRAGAHAQTMALYRLIDEIRARYPNLEIESCSSGGARADFEILSRSERIWAADSNDALERQAIQRGFSMLFPPEVMGSHIGPPISHTTSRQHDLGLRTASTFFGHMGIEWNLLNATEADRAEIADSIGLHKKHRTLLHGGDTRRIDHPESSVNIMGVVATDRSEALFSYVRTATMTEAVPAPMRLAGLDPDRRYRITRLPLPGSHRDHSLSPPEWLARLAQGDEVIATGRLLMTAGLQPPILHPESAMILHFGSA
jgi:alpha-galactosidase